MSKSASTFSAAAAALLLASLSAVPALAGPPAKVAKKKPATHTAAAAMYECTKCHMKVTAAVAKKDHYKDPMDGGTLVPVKSSAKSASPAPKKMDKMDKMGKMGSMKGM